MKIRILFFFVTVFAIASNAFACWSVGSTTTITFPAQTISGAQDAMVPGAAVSSGATNNSLSFSIFQISSDLTCNDGSGAVGIISIPESVKKTTVSYTQNGVEHAVWESGVPGIGIAMAARLNDTADWVPIASAEQSIGTVTGSWLSFKVQLRATLVATGRVKSGSYSISVSPTSYIKQKSTAKVLRSDGLGIKGAVTVKAGSCNLTNGAKQSVLLPKVSIYSIGRQDPNGVSEGSSSPFSLGLQCDSGVKVHATMTDASNPLNSTDTLSLGAGSTASGVGIRIYRENETTPVSYGPDSAANGNSNQWYVGTAGSNGVVGLSFVAKYAKTGATITPGSVAAQSTITFSYQ
ncbi:fimbrial protein [Burkholderia stabilis]|nr:fimbrial protein [Burkholderia stabilis]